MMDIVLVSAVMIGAVALYVFLNRGKDGE